MSALPAPGLADPVHDAQHSFRLALDALSRPGRIQRLEGAIDGVALGAAQARLLLTLTDESTCVWWQHASKTLQQWLRFHTGARSTTRTEEADFAVVTQPADMPELARFAAGTAAAPEHSCTLLVEVPSITSGLRVQAHGPGIRDSIEVAVAGLPEGFWAEWQASHAAFPQGVDIFFTCGEMLLGLPRTSRIGRLQGV
jgi:alpha-D-ribose 1-methylphosphonate 5-triphosphate synthase subunit PhnH